MYFVESNLHLFVVESNSLDVEVLSTEDVSSQILECMMLVSVGHYSIDVCETHARIVERICL